MFPENGDCPNDGFDRDTRAHYASHILLSRKEFSSVFPRAAPENRPSNGLIKVSPS
jgi:hypothetical protein